MRGEIIELISRLGDISLTAIKNQIPHAKGEYNFMFPAKGIDNTNILLCSGVSIDFVKVMTDLINEGVISFEPIDQLTVIADGGELYNLPLAKPPKVEYDELHFLPLIIKKGDNM